MCDTEDNNSVWDAYRERGVSEEQIAILKKQVESSTGHDVDTELKSIGFQFTTDLNNFECPNMSYLLTLYEQWEKGQLAYNGSVSDQPSKLIETMNLLGNLKAEQTDKIRKKQEKEMKRK